MKENITEYLVEVGYWLAGTIIGIFLVFVLSGWIYFDDPNFDRTQYVASLMLYAAIIGFCGTFIGSVYLYIKYFKQLRFALVMISTILVVGKLGLSPVEYMLVLLAAATGSLLMLQIASFIDSDSVDEVEPVQDKSKNDNRLWTKKINAASMMMTDSSQALHTARTRNLPDRRTWRVYNQVRHGGDDISTSSQAAIVEKDVVNKDLEHEQEKNNLSSNHHDALSDVSIFDEGDDDSDSVLVALTSSELRQAFASKKQSQQEEYVDKSYDKVENTKIAHPNLDHPELLSDLSIFTALERERLRGDWELFRDILLENNIFKFYHFTYENNLQSIEKMDGLFSWKYCENNNIQIPMPGGNSLSRELDSRKGLEDYVRLCFTKDHPMYNILSRNQDRRMTFLEIDPRICYFSDTLFSDINATANMANIGPNENDFSRIKLDVINNKVKYPKMDYEKKKKYRQAEVLVLTHLPSKYILDL